MFRKCWCLLAMCAVLHGVPVLGQDKDASSLQGITGVRVVIEDISPEAEGAGLTKARVQSDVEAWLRKNGVAVDSRAAEQFYVDVDTGKGAAGGYAYGIDVGLRQPATLQRTGKTVLADTWSDGTVGSATAAKLANTVRDQLRDLLDEFIEEYVAANRKH